MALRRWLLAGLVVTIPILVTLYVLNAVFSFLSAQIGTKVQKYLAAHIPLLGADQPAVAVLVGVVLTVSLLLAVGAIGSTVVGKRAVALGEYLVQRTPVIGWVYATARQVVELLFATNRAAFREVVLVEYPVPGTYVVGFVTAEPMAVASERAGTELVNVFVPYSPTPVTGILLLVPRSKLLPVGYTVEQGMKLIISGGVLTPDSLSPPTGQTGE